MNNITYTLAQKTDDTAIRNILASNPIPGEISLIYQKNPNFFESVNVGYINTTTGVMKDKNKVIGFLTIGEKEVFINGKQKTIGYLCNLRLDEKYQGKNVLKGGFEQFHQIDWNKPMPFYLSTIINTNKKALDLLTKRRSDGLNFIDMGSYITKAILFTNKKRIKSTYTVQRGDASNLQSIVSFLNEEGSKKNFYPNYRLSDFKGVNSLKDFNINDFYIARKDGKIVGVVAKWDQKNFKQNIIHSSKKSFKFKKNIYNGMAHLFGYTCLPQIDQEIKLIYLSHIAIKNNDPEIFSFLLKSVYNDLLKSGYQFLMVGLHESDPLIKSLSQYSGLIYKSRLFMNTWQKSFNKYFDDKVIYMELATL